MVCGRNNGPGRMKCSMFCGNRGALMLLIFVIGRSDGCPAPCTCKWKNGKQTVECIDKDLLIIPEGMDSGTQVLEFCGNNLHTLHRDKFLKMDLINLQRIYLCRCRITTIDDRTFKGLTNLVELDLSGNLLESVPSGSFLDCPSLMRLILSSNPIRALRNAAFGHLSFLGTLEINNCQISKVEEGAFHGLYNLEWLHLNGNKLTRLHGCNYLPETLKGIQLQENPWECDCHILDLHAWLATFNIPQSMEPVCNGPNRLKGRAIKSVPLGELACLPDVSPTTFYLEIAEGKNVSLLCEVRAVPEAAISWKFQGQLLQNDSMVAPGVHLLYFIEEGTVQKRSELFIYNTNTEDNGTFICNAENPAGLAQANFTIRVIVKHEPRAEPNDLPFEFILITLSSAAVSVVLLIIVVILSIVKCHRNQRLRKKRNNTKVTLSNSTKDSLLQQDSTDEYSDHKEGSNIIKLVNSDEETMLYSPHPVDEIVASPIPATSLVGSPASLHRYQIEQNPDLINGTESVGRFRERDSYHTTATPLKKRLGPQPPQQQQQQQHQRVFQQSMVDFKGANDLYMLASDVRLNPVSLLKPTAEGRVAAVPHFSGSCYKTLPYNRAAKRQTLANPVGRYAREAEFLSRVVHQPAVSYENYVCDVRYTADGYPARTSADAAAVSTTVSCSSPVESHKSDSAVEACCSSTRISWPSCVPAKSDNSGVTNKSVAAQTDMNNSMSGKTENTNKILNKSVSNLAKETLTESPDEGYEGESADTNTSSCQN